MMGFRMHLCYIMILYLLNNIVTEKVPSTTEQPAVGLSNQWGLNVTNVGGAFKIIGSKIETTWSNFVKFLTDFSECEKDEFKPLDDNISCYKCGQNSVSNDNRTKCICNPGFYREIGKEMNYKEMCYEIPTIPTMRNTTATSTEISLEWSKDKDPDAIYIILCKNCPSDQNFTFRTNETNITIRNLGSFVKYDLQLIVEENNNKEIGRWKTLNFHVTTKKGTPGTVQDITHTINNDGSVTLRWNPPFARGSDTLKYLISFGGSSKETSKTEYTIKSDAHSRIYTVTVTAQAIVDGKILSGPAFTYFEKIKVIGGVLLTTTVSVEVGGIIFDSSCGLLYLEEEKSTFFTSGSNGRWNSRLKNSSHGLYVDPTTYNAVDDAVQEFSCQLDLKQLKIGNLIGGGEFADVYKGTLTNNGKSKEVAIKTLKSNASKMDRDDFLSEAAIIGQFNDPNVISLEGVILGEQNIIALEFMVNGALDKFLQANDDQFTNLQLLKMACDVVSGMKYLSELGFIHRDLAARNILVDENRTCKVSDFGMSREIKVDDTYNSQGGKIPLRWTAPEAIEFKKFTTASDVWSYGILLWEIMSYGEIPYCDLSNYKVLERLGQGYRLPSPMNCPKEIHDLMLRCWNKDRIKRPKMSEIWHQLKLWIGRLEGLDRYENLDYTVLQTINGWLDALGMSRYVDMFLEQGFATPQHVFDLTLNDLEELGIALIGDRKIIFKAIQNTKDRDFNLHVTYIDMSGTEII